jgi:hypothetical protein
MNAIAAVNRSASENLTTIAGQEVWGREVTEAGIPYYQRDVIDRTRGKMRP